ncbi:MAG: AbrB/MazE/SpoVT family DNA-binding domain-containing protein, partial [Nitrosopumilaceae archaeon]|nr:AbrB/MazE/SpoVT family DNA-binding domain-containing protein [Nitrosopumilaceae archaeon]
KTLERRIQLRGHSFVLTIPRAVVKKMKIRNGQSVRFLVGDGEIVIRPMSAGVGDGAADPAGPDQYVRAIEEMMAKNEPKRPHARGTTSGRSKLERLRIK